MNSSRVSPRDIARHLKPEASSRREVVGRLTEQMCDAMDRIRPREGLCAFDANGMNEIEGRK